MNLVRKFSPNCVFFRGYNYDPKAAFSEADGFYTIQDDGVYTFTDENGNASKLEFKAGDQIKMPLFVHLDQKL